MTPPPKVKFILLIHWFIFTNRNIKILTISTQHIINNINYTIIIKLNQVHSNHTVPPSHLIYNKMCLIFAPLKKQSFLQLCYLYHRMTIFRSD